jgi:hypothetical protein
MSIQDESRGVSLDSLQSIWDNILSGLPKILGFVGYIILSWLLIKIILYVIKKALSKTKLDEWSEKLKETKIFGNTTLNIVLTKVILTTLKWFLVLIFVLIGADIFGLDMVSEGISSFIGYLPKLISALLIFVGGVYLATLVKKAIHATFKSLEITGGNLVGNILFYLIVVFISITALDQAGVDTSVIKSNITLILGSIVLSFTIAFGLGSKEIIQRLLFGFYSRKNLNVGQRIKIGDVQGVIESIDNIYMTLITTEGKFIYPIKEVSDKIIQIIDDKN